MDLFARVEAERFAAKERLKRRQMRIVQVREQTLNWMSKSRERFEQEKSRQMEILVEELTAEVEDEMFQQIEQLTEAHDLALGEIGGAHRAAMNMLIPPETDDKRLKRLKGESLAKNRYNAALKKEREGKIVQKENSVKLQKVRENIRIEASIHAKELSERMPFKPLSQNLRTSYHGRDANKNPKQVPPFFQQSMAGTLHIPSQALPPGSTIQRKKAKSKSPATSTIVPRHSKPSTTSGKNAGRQGFVSPSRKRVAPATGVFAKVAAEKAATKTKEKLGTIVVSAENAKTSTSRKTGEKAPTPKKNEKSDMTSASAPKEPQVITTYKRGKLPPIKKSRAPPAVDYYDASIPLHPVKYIPPPGLVQSIPADSANPTAWANADRLNEEAQTLEAKKSQVTAESAKKAEERGKNAMQLAKLDKKMKQLSTALFEHELNGLGQGRLSGWVGGATYIGPPTPPNGEILGQGIRNAPSQVGLDQISPPASIYNVSTSSEDIEDGPPLVPSVHSTFIPYEDSRVAQLAKENISWIDQQLNLLRESQMEIPLKPRSSFQQSIDDINLMFGPQSFSGHGQGQTLSATVTDTVNPNTDTATVKQSSANTDLRYTHNGKHKLKKSVQPVPVPVPVSVSTQQEQERISEESVSSGIPSPVVPIMGPDFQAIDSPSSASDPSPSSSKNGSAVDAPAPYSEQAKLPPLILPKPLEQNEMDKRLGTLITPSPAPLLPPGPTLQKSDVQWFSFKDGKKSSSRIGSTNTSASIGTTARPVTTTTGTGNSSARPVPTTANTIVPSSISDPDTFETWPSGYEPNFPRTRLESGGSSISSLEREGGQGQGVVNGTHLDSPSGPLSPTGGRSTTTNATTSRGPLTSTPGSSKGNGRQGARVQEGVTPGPAIKILNFDQRPSTSSRLSNSSRPGTETETSARRAMKTRENIENIPPVTKGKKERSEVSATTERPVSPSPSAENQPSKPPPHHKRQCADRARWDAACRDIGNESSTATSRRESVTTPRTSRVLKHYMRKLLGMRPESVEALSATTSGSSSSTSVILVNSSAAVSGASTGLSSLQQFLSSSGRLDSMTSDGNIPRPIMNPILLSSIDETDEDEDESQSHGTTTTTNTSGATGTDVTSTDTTTGTTGTNAGAKVIVNFTDESSTTEANTSHSAASLTRILTNMCVKHCLDDDGLEILPVTNGENGSDSLESFDPRRRRIPRRKTTTDSELSQSETNGTNTATTTTDSESSAPPPTRKHQSQSKAKR